MEQPLLIITSSITILSLVFLFLYFRKYQELSDLKNKFDALRLSEKNGSDAQKAREEFLAMIVHELRSPLSVIRGSSDILLKDAAKLTADQVKEMLSEIKDSSADLIVLVNDLLDVSKIESGRFDIYKKDADINQLLSDESHRYSALSKEKNITLQVDLDKTVPNFQFDAEKIRQVLNNLISNALKFTPGNGVVSIKSETAGNMVRVSITDTGIGIPDAIKTKIFNKFVQGPPDKENHEKGTGLGLFISKGIVEAHGGAIWMQDNQPQGSRFIFTLPLS